MKTNKEFYTPPRVYILELNTKDVLGNSNATLSDGDLTLGDERW